MTTSFRKDPRSFLPRSEQPRDTGRKVTKRLFNTAAVPKTVQNCADPQPKKHLENLRKVEDEANQLIDQFEIKAQDIHFKPITIEEHLECFFSEESLLDREVYEVEKLLDFRQRFERERDINWLRASDKQSTPSTLTAKEIKDFKILTYAEKMKTNLLEQLSYDKEEDPKITSEQRSIQQEHNNLASKEDIFSLVDKLETIFGTMSWPIKKKINFGEFDIDGTIDKIEFYADIFQQFDKPGSNYYQNDESKEYVWRKFVGEIIDVLNDIYHRRSLTEYQYKAANKLINIMTTWITKCNKWAFKKFSAEYESGFFIKLQRNPKSLSVYTFRNDILIIRNHQVGYYLSEKFPDLFIHQRDLLKLTGYDYNNLHAAITSLWNKRNRGIIILSTDHLLKQLRFNDTAGVYIAQYVQDDIEVKYGRDIYPNKGEDQIFEDPYSFLTILNSYKKARYRLII